MRIINKIDNVLNEGIKLWGKYNNARLSNEIRKIKSEIGSDIARNTGEPLEKAKKKIKEMAKISVVWNEKLLKDFDETDFTPEQIKRRTTQIQKDIDLFKEWEKQSKVANHKEMGNILNKIIERYSLY